MKSKPGTIYSFSRFLCVVGALFISSGYSATVVAQEPKITTVPVTDGVYMLQGRGGNIGVSVGTDGVFMIDDQYAPMSDAIRAAVAKLSDQPIRFLINTHWHGDHTGGNENFGKLGATIVAHDNVRARLASGGEVKAFKMVAQPAPAAALPVITFADGITFHWNGDTLRVEHVASAHTDGDSVIYFTEANVVHTGDLYFNGFYPFIDASSGGAMAGVIDGVARMLARIDDRTRIIPGHGPVSNKAELQAYHDMLKSVYQRIKGMKDAGKSAQEVVAAKPTAAFDAEWGSGFLQPDKWVEIVYAAI
ncbi:MBL fold metallo-hydrolase [Exilibacterium tricleocarpae]|uniref:MBL fold metallo-hydrolase n=1 Tax=Exilibacterium tricleocarpae TaxID=2591008 RepID=UPI001FE2DA21|nr:MBL fold metallo-hydrolase [Exilibacterium tricleocarpae]